VLDSEEAFELAELEATETLFDKELESEEESELADEEAFEAPSESWLLPETIDDPATSDKLDADFETSDAMELRLLDAFSTTPGSAPTIEDDAFAERLLAL